ncbi:hypothetical protein [Halorubrum halophilum]|uniref:hypothetical protein n=1 Tax=Halorubrum halophilum TaxID=413816 RepID=UPI00186ADE2C|nr:hypothetical protein [Halorubrum halophilum]
MPGQQIPPILEELWANWQQDDGGTGRCEGCPAHWSTRDDFSGAPEDRTSSFQHRPSCGDGSLDPDILIVPREPGKPREDDFTKNRRKDSIEQARNKSILDSPGGTIENAMPLFEIIEESEFSVGFTQIRKCNELKSGDNNLARKQCSGSSDEHVGYLAEEVRSLNPEYIITLTTAGQRDFCNVFDLPRYAVEDMAGGSAPSGLCAEYQNEFEFTWFPAPHPDHRAAAQVYNKLEADFDTEEYFEAFGEDVLNYVTSDN